MGCTDGEHLGLDLSHVFSGHRRALIGVGRAAMLHRPARVRATFPAPIEGNASPTDGRRGSRASAVGSRF